MGCIQASSAAAERVFSNAGRFMTPQKERLGAETMGKTLYCRMNGQRVKKSALWRYKGKDFTPPTSTSSLPSDDATPSTSSQPTGALPRTSTSLPNVSVGGPNVSFDSDDEAEEVEVGTTSSDEDSQSEEEEPTDSP